MADDRFAPFYDHGFAERVFTCAEVERQGRYLIYRALNIGRAIAFVGSGLSAGYGHPLWADLLAEAQDKIIKDVGDASNPTTGEFYVITKGGLGSSEPDLQPLRAHMLEVIAGDDSKVKSSIAKNIEETKTGDANPGKLAHDLASTAYKACGLRKRPAAPAEKEPPVPRLPARELFTRLGVKRIVTTNYDVVLEDTLKEELGYPLGYSGSVWTGERITGERARTALLNADTTAALIDFAVRASTFEHEVFHLHGRFDDKDSLIVTERDYQRAYLRNTPDRHVLEEALNVVFAGNPIIFVGMGMVEADVLRPLRRFISNPEMRINHNIVALMPAEQRVARRTYSALNLHLRYGVHAIFYGLDRSEQPREFNPAPWDAASKPREEDAWLYRSISTIARLCEALEDPAQIQAHRSNNPDYQYLNDVCDAAQRLDAKDPFLLSALSNVQMALTHALDNVEVLERKEVRDGLSIALRQIDRVIRTHALSDALADLATERDEWWKSWRRLPEPRRYVHGIEEFNKTPTADGDLPIERVGEGKAPIKIAVERHAGGGIEFSDKHWRRLSLSNLGAPPSDLAKTHNDRPLRAIRFTTTNIARDEAIAKIAERVRKTLEDEAFTKSARVVIVHGGIGSGRGSLFGLLQEKVTSECQWQLFINASYSTEYSSVVDGLTDFIWRLTNKVDDETPFTGPAKPRLEVIRAFLEQLKDQRKGKRLLVVLHGVELLFHTDGRPKNDEIIAALRVFLGYPVDLVFMVQSDRAREIFGPGFSGEDRVNGLVLGRPDRLTDKELADIHLDRDAEPIVAPATFSATCFRIPALEQERFKSWLESEKVALEFESEKWDAAKWENFNEALVRLELKYFERGPKDRFIASCILRALWTTFDRSGDRDKALRRLDSLVCDIATRASDDRHENQVLLQIIEHYREIFSKEWPLCEEILKHLSIISAPVEASVLTRCPKIEEQQATPEKIEDACKLLVRLGLIYRIGRRPSVGQTSSPFRFAPHKSFQSLFYRRIGSPHLEFGDSRLFTVSLYSSQRVDLPAPTEGAYDFLTNLINALSGRNGAANSANDANRRSDEERAADVMCLRAAVSVVRSALSFAVVCRLGTIDERGRKERLHGRLEYVRLLLRWLIFRAGMLGDEVTKEDVEALNGEAPKRCPPHRRKWRLNALYQDEITWLYNECGIVSLAQGNMYDAWALLRQARSSNRKVEGHLNDGPNAMRIQMNLALTEIVRGNLARADDYINQVRHATFNNNRLLYAVSTGYHGLVAHMRGRFDQAKRLYIRAIALARGASGEGRLLSILHRHYGDLLRDTGMLPEAREQLRAARAEAETSRQQDQAHKTLVAQARLEIEGGALEAGKSREVLKMIVQAERYADQMELHSLKVEAAAARSLVFERQGESRLSGDAAIAGLSIATLYGMRLRVMTALCRVGRAAIARGHREQADVVLNAALRMSEASGYQLCSEQARQSLNQL